MFTDMTPPLVTAARATAAATGFAHSSTDEVGRLLRTLVATIDDGVVAEIGSGCGVGTAWLASALRPDVSLVTVELDAERARRVAGLFARATAVTVLSGDWHQLRERAPFALLFGDGDRCKDEDLHPLLRRGGIVVLDDFTDPADWSDERRQGGDPLRDRWLSDPRYATTMVGVGLDKLTRASRAQALVATRL